MRLFRSHQDRVDSTYAQSIGYQSDGNSIVLSRKDQILKINEFNKSIQGFVNKRLQLKTAGENQVSVSDICFFITVKYLSSNKFTGYKGVSVLARQNSIFRGRYIDICKASLGPRFSRKRKIQPEVFSFIDVSGTKYGTKTIQNANDSPHIHAIMIVHPSQSKWWSNKSNVESIRSILSNRQSIESIDFSRVKDGNDIGYLTGYAAKYYTANFKQPQISDELFKIYPDVNH